MELGNARKWAAEILEDYICPGMVAIDATLGNGGDTCFLAEKVGEKGRVYGFDIQEEAVNRTREKLTEKGLLDRVKLICSGHENMLKFVREPVDAIMFNLGWLPGADRDVFTRTETTLKALDASLALLKKGAVMTVCVYPGHDEGKREKKAVEEWAASLPMKTIQVMTRRYLNQPENTPLLFVLQRIAL